MKKRGSTLLTENVVFIILNVAFIAILIVFLLTRASNTAVMEEKYSKEIALLLDSAKPGMTITLDMSDAIKSAEKNLGEQNLEKAVMIRNNIVTVKLKDSGGYSYSFFNDIKVENKYFDRANGKLLLFIGDYNE